MSLFKEADLQARADRGIARQKTADGVLLEKVAASLAVSEFDIFLSHSLSDHKIILGILLSLEDMGYKVYVDWVHDRQLDRGNVTPDTANLLRHRMRTSKSLFFATTSNSSSSKWMPWELGFKDGLNGKAAILPVSKTNTESFVGQEYLGVYPYVSKDVQVGGVSEKLWINKSPSCYVLFDKWLEGKEPYDR